MIVTDDMPCNCRYCHVCEMLGIAYPVPRPPMAPPADEKPTRPPKPTHRTLFDDLPPTDPENP